MISCKSHTRLQQIIRLDVFCSNAVQHQSSHGFNSYSASGKQTLDAGHLSPTITAKLYYKNCIQDTLRNVLIIKAILISI